MAFPTNPSPGDIHTENGKVYIYVTVPPPPTWDLIGTAGPEARYENTYSGAVWTVGHNLGQRYVAVQCLDAAGNVMIGDPNFTSNAVLTVTFSEPVTGTAVVRR